MRYILLILFSVSILTACVSPSKRIYWHPEAPGGVIETYDDIIYAHDYNIPTRGIVFQAPNDVEFRIISHEVGDPSRLIMPTTYSGFAIAINIPEGVVVKFLSKNFRIIDKRSGEIFIHQQEEIVAYGYFKILWFDAGYINYPDMSGYNRSKEIPFMDQLVGSTVVKEYRSIVPIYEKYKKPYLIIFNVKHNDLNEYSLEIPPILINGKTFQIPVINFRKKEGSFLLKIH